MCTVCLGTDLNNKSGVTEKLSACSGCGVYVHLSCTKAGPELAGLLTKGGEWFCEECRDCAGCGKWQNNQMNHQTNSINRFIVNICRQHRRVDVFAVLLQLRTQLPHGLPRSASWEEAEVPVALSTLSRPPREQDAEIGGGRQCAQEIRQSAREDQREEHKVHKKQIWNDLIFDIRFLGRN